QRALEVLADAGVLQRLLGEELCGAALVAMQRRQCADRVRRHATRRVLDPLSELLRFLTGGGGLLEPTIGAEALLRQREEFFLRRDLVLLAVVLQAPAPRLGLLLSARRLDRTPSHVAGARRVTAAACRQVRGAACLRRLVAHVCRRARLGGLCRRARALVAH